MVRARTVYSCTDCGTNAVQWAGRCPGCGAWNTLVEEAVAPRPSQARAVDPPLPITQVDPRQWHPRPTGLDELDRVLGGGLVRGSVTLLGGEPGVGKSTLLLQAVASLARSGARCLYLSGEESAAQVQGRAARVGALVDGIWFSAESDVKAIVGLIDELGPDFVVVDSVQTAHDPDLGTTPGTVTQVRGCAQQLIDAIKRRQTAMVLVGHVTKEGELAGPRVLEHAVDTVLSFGGDRHHALRLLRAVKHRFGSTDELGLFEMSEGGLIGVPDPSALFLADRRAGVPGSVVVPTVDGNRPLLVEVQALVASAGPSGPRRSAQGTDAGRLALLTAVLEQRVGISLAALDVYVSVVGGVRVTEPGCDLGIALAIVSAVCSRALPSDLVALGEVGLAGELRQVAQTPRRVAEARRLGFGQLVVAQSAPATIDGGAVRRAATLAEALDLVGLGLVDPDVDGRGLDVPAGRPGERDRASTIASWCLVAAPTWCKPSRAVAPGTAAARRPRPRPQGEDGCADRRRRRPRGAQHLLGWLPARRGVQPPAPVRAGEDGRRDHPRLGREPHRASERPPRPRPERRDVRDRHPAPHG